MANDFDHKYYDNIYSTNNEYKKNPLECRYFDIWKQALKLIPKGMRIYDIGCGTGQFTRLALDCKRTVSRAVDYSPVAIKIAKEMNRGHEKIFIVQDLTRGQRFTNFDIAVIFEVLEHIKEDLLVLKNLPVGKQVIFSVPSYGGMPHVRKFLNYGQIKKRYSGLVKITFVKSFTWNRRNPKTIWLVSGTRI